MAESKSKTGFAFAVGPREDALAFLGRETEPYVGDVEMSRTMIREYCSVIEDANPAYWDEQFAQREWGGVVVPPGMMMIWLMKLSWTPSSRLPEPPLMGRVPVPGDTAINVRNDTEFFLPARLGDDITMTEHLADISEEKRTRVGVGHFVTTVSTYRRSDGAVVAKQTNTLFRFRSEEPNASEVGAA